jgi:SAM-dependent methyltransferase
MHPTSLENMRLAKTKIPDLGNNITIVDVGGRGTKKIPNRSYQEIFKDVYKYYYVADINKGPGVTHIMPEQYKLPFADNSIDLVVSGQTLEHVRNPFKMIAEIKRIIKPNRYMIIIAPSTGPNHDDVDCWRYMRDSFKAIAEECKIKVIADWITDDFEFDKDSYRFPSRRNVWSDHTFIGQK